MKKHLGITVVASLISVGCLGAVVDTVVKPLECVEEPSEIFGTKGVYKFAPFSLGKQIRPFYLKMVLSSGEVRDISERGTTRRNSTSGDWIVTYSQFGIDNFPKCSEAVEFHRIIVK